MLYGGCISRSHTLQAEWAFVACIARRHRMVIATRFIQKDALKYAMRAWLRT